MVDETDNGQHSVPADKFIPPSIKEEEMEPEEEEYIDPNTDEHPGGAQEKQSAQAGVVTNHTIEIPIPTGTSGSTATRSRKKHATMTSPRLGTARSRGTIQV